MQVPHIIHCCLPILSALHQVTEAVSKVAKTQEELRKSLAEDTSEEALQQALESQSRILSLYKSGFKKDLAKLVQ